MKGYDGNPNTVEETNWLCKIIDLSRPFTLDKKPAIIYHGENTKNNYVIIAKNNELSKWNKPLPINKNKFKINFWDPDCFIINNTYYSISGGINPDLFKSKNLIEWEYVGKSNTVGVPDLPLIDPRTDEETIYFKLK